jgi:alpha-mannosidase
MSRDDCPGGAPARSCRPLVVTDGQTSVVDDYLEIRPEQRDRVIGRLRAGKLVIGPWYTMPDEFVVGGESLVRNLLLGREQARALGVDASKAGLVCDRFGHARQVPQILRGFGSLGALIWRGVNTDKRTCSDAGPSTCASWTLQARCVS